ncbi:MAG: hypothetical protein AB7R89_28350 [Dehalococcoidia bacterium]
MNDERGSGTGSQAAVDGVLAASECAQPAQHQDHDEGAGAAAGQAPGERADAGAGDVIHVCAYTPDGQRCAITGLRGALPVWERAGYVVVREVATEAEAGRWVADATDGGVSADDIDLADYVSPGPQATINLGMLLSKLRYEELLDAEARVAALETLARAAVRFIDRDLMPRYVELLEAAGIPRERSVAVEDAKTLLADPLAVALLAREDGGA